MPQPGTLVGAGTTQVTLTAHDNAGNTADLSFPVGVRFVATFALAMKGGEVPGAGTDFRIPEGAKWGAFGAPSITAEGMNAGWQASVVAPRGVSFHGIFSGPIDAPVLRLRTGEIARDAIGAGVNGVTFQSFREPVFAGDDFAVMATLKGPHVSTGNRNATGIWVGQSGLPKEIARQGTAAPGAGGAKFAAFTSLAMPAPDAVFFTARLTAPVAKDVGLWVWTAATGTKLVLREGDDFSLPRLRQPLKSFQALSSVPGSPGHGRYDADLKAIDVLVTLPSGQAIARVGANGQTQLVAASAYAFSPSLTFNLPSSPGRGGLPSVLATFPFVSLPGIPVLKRTCIYQPNSFPEYAGSYLAQTDQPAPGAEPAVFRSFLDPVSGYDFADVPVQFFAAMLAGAAKSADTGLWVHGSALELVAREGAEPPGAPGTKWASFTSLSVLEGRGPMFTAKLASGATRVTAGNDAGLWATDSAGSLRLIFREGQEVVPGKNLQSFQLLGAVAGSPGQRRAWASADASAQVIYLAFFTDGTSAILRVTVP
jgi:hypothetical protein